MLIGIDDHFVYTLGNTSQKPYANKRGCLILSSLDTFINKGWEFGAQGTLQAQSGDKGGATTDAASFSKSTEIYQLGKNGLMAEATVAGTKFWKDKALN